MAKLILNDKVNTILTVIKVNLDGKIYSIPNKGQKIIEVEKGEHKLRAYKSIFGKGPIKKLNITEDVTEIDIKGNKEVFKSLFIVIAAIWIIIPLSIFVPVLLLPVVIILPIVMYVIGQKKGAYTLEINNNKNIQKL